MSHIDTVIARLETDARSALVEIGIDGRCRLREGGSLRAELVVRRHGVGAWTVHVRSSWPRPVDILGVGLLRRRVAARPDLVVPFRIDVQGAPGIHATWSAHLAATGTGVHVAEGLSPAVTIEAPYADVLAWLHGGAMLGDLIRGGHRVHGGVGPLSAIDGIIHAPGSRMPDRVWTSLGALSSAEAIDATWGP